MVTGHNLCYFPNGHGNSNGHEENDHKISMNVTLTDQSISVRNAYRLIIGIS